MSGGKFGNPKFDCTPEFSECITYETLEEAIVNGHQVQRCSIDNKFNAVNWTPVKYVDRSWDISRYRIVEKKS